jgi:ATP-dependent Lon protease
VIFFYGDEKLNIHGNLPLLPLRDIIIFPHMVYPLLVGRPFTISAVREALDYDKQIFLCAQKSPEIDTPRREDLFSIGVVARILQVMKLPNGTMKVLVEGLVRGKVKSFRKIRDFYTVSLGVVILGQDRDKKTEALSRTVADLFAEYVHLNRRIPDEVLLSMTGIDDYQRLADTTAAHILQKMDVKQDILAQETVKEQLDKIAAVLRFEIEILKIEQKIDGTVRDALTRDQKEFYLQKQLKAIKEELGQPEDIGSEVDDLWEKLEGLAAPAEVKAKVEEEIKKLAKMHPYSAESSVVRGYVEWILALPWGKYTSDRSIFEEVKSILDGDHYGLEKTKKRILEHLAVLKVAGKVKGPILCLVGPPGVGKTSVGKSIARALDRKFVRMSLGGIHDEAEIRGHRRTYIGSLPGRIIQSIKKAGSSNPVFLLDEVDKIGTDFRGDPAAALLEVLDPEQNIAFSDNYLEIDYDLSRVLFITTANSVSGIPPALQDRMELLHLPGYLEYEKIKIIRGYLLPKLKREMGLEHTEIDFTDTALYTIIRYYTREAGVRDVERQLASILRMLAQRLAEGSHKKRFKIGTAAVGRMLGAPKYQMTDIISKPEPGYAVGLAWTESGGEILPIEVRLMAGAAKLTMTGKLGTVMQESAMACLSYIRSRAEEFGLKPDFFEKLDVHIHIPEGAVPKDGPSAGITMLIALLSALTRKVVRNDLCMTGEITLSGDVLAIGGLNEKLLAAKRSGIRNIILPHRNKKDIPELSKELTKDLNLILIKKVDEAVRIAFNSRIRNGKGTAKGKSGV